MDSLLIESQFLCKPSLAAAALRPSTRLPFFSGPTAPSSLPMVHRQSFCLSTSTSGRIRFSARNGALVSNSVESKNRNYTVGDFMTKREDLIIVYPSTSVDEALEKLVEYRITGFPVIDRDWTLVGVVSDYDLLALDSISGHGRTDPSIFPDVDSTWKTFNEIQKLLGKTNGKIIDDVMTPAPLVVHETTNLEDAARLLLETKYRRLPVVGDAGKLVGLITRGNVVRAALQIKHGNANKA